MAYNTDFYLDDLKNYIKEIEQFPLLTKEEEYQLAVEKSKGNKEARTKLITSNLRLVVKIVLSFSDSFSYLTHLQFLDLIQEGNAELAFSVDKFNLEKGTSLSTFAYSSIEGAIKRAIIFKECCFKESRKVKEDRISYIRALKRYTEEKLPIPSDEELRGILGITNKALQKAKNNPEPLSLNMKISSSSNQDVELGSIIEIEEEGYNQVINNIEDFELLLALKTLLTPIDYYIIYHCYLKDSGRKNITEIADELRLKRQYVGNKKNKALKIIEQLITDNQSKMKDTILNLKKEEGINYDKLKVDPLSPIDFILYTYIMKSLTKLERELFKIIHFSKYNYRMMDLKEYFNIPLEELKAAYVRLNRKIKLLLANVNEWETYKNNILDYYKSRIFKIDIEEFLKNENIEEFILKYRR